MGKKVNRRKFRSDEATTVLRNDIISGVYKPGMFLPAERKLTEVLDISRGTVRAAIRSLQREGLVRINPGRGAYVADTVGRKGLQRFIVFLGDNFAPIGRATEGVGLLLGVCRQASKLNAEAIISFSRHDDIAQEVISRYASGNIQGIIYSDCHDYKKYVAPLEKNSIPYAVGNLEFDNPSLAAKMDFRAVGRAAGRHLVELGHRNIGMLSGPLDKFIYKELLAGFRGALAEEEINLEHKIEVVSDIEDSRMASLRMLSAANRPSAIFAARDVRAAGCFLACRELGLRIPDDLSVVGYDDITWPEGRSVGLTTIREPIEEMGEATVDLLNEWLLTGKHPGDRIFTGNLVLRASTKKIEN